MGQKFSLPVLNQDSTTLSAKDNVSKSLTPKLKILVDTWFPYSVDLGNNAHRVSSFFSLRKDGTSQLNPSFWLTLSPQGSRQLRKKSPDTSSDIGQLQNTLKITPDEQNCFQVQCLDPKMKLWKFVKQWCQFNQQDPLYINGVWLRVTKLVKKAGKLLPQKKLAFKDLEGKLWPCRICLENTYHQRNMLMSLCKCKGSMGNVHPRCLAPWILEKNQVQKDSFLSNLKKQRCEFCNSSYIDSKAFKQILQDVIFQTQGLQTPYVILYGSSQSKRFIGVSFKHNRIFQIEGPLNCKLKYENNQIYIMNNNSRLGTGIRTQWPNRIMNNQEQCKFMVNNDMTISFSVLSKGNKVPNSLDSTTISEGKITN